MLAIDDTLEILGIDLVGVIPEDELIFRSSNLGEPAVTDNSSLAGEAYRNVTKAHYGRGCSYAEPGTKIRILW